MEASDVHFSFLGVKSYIFILSKLRLIKAACPFYSIYLSNNSPFYLKAVLAQLCAFKGYALSILLKYI